MKIFKKSKASQVDEKELLQIEVSFSSKHLIDRILKYGIPITMCLGMQNAGSLIDMFNVISRLLFCGFSDISSDALLGTLGQFNTFINVPMTIIATLSTALLPSIAASNILV